MQIRNETDNLSCRFLSDDQFPIAHQVFSESFSDYSALETWNEDLFRKHLRVNAIDLNRSAGCFRGDRMIGISINGFGKWNDKETVYDGGTGVIPSERRSGAARSMFEMMLPEFKRVGIEQYLLEVITTNHPAVTLYEKLGFKVHRELLILEAADGLKKRDGADFVQIRPLQPSDLDLYSGFSDGSPAWQNSNEAVVRSAMSKTIFGAFTNEQCVGYIAFSNRVGRIAQLSVDPKFRHRGVGTSLVNAMMATVDENFKPQALNVDGSLGETIEFLTNAGFRKKFTQYEMVLRM